MSWCLQANIMKKSDGLFLESCQEVAKKYKGIKYEEIIVDNCMMQVQLRTVCGAIALEGDAVAVGGSSHHSRD